MAENAYLHRPQQVAHPVGNRGLGINDRYIDIVWRRPDAVRADEVDFDVRVLAPEVPQERGSQVDSEARRHLDAQSAQLRRAGAADFVQGILETVEGLGDRREQVVARRRKQQLVRPTVEQLHAHEAFQRYNVAGKRALRGLQGVGGSRETAMTCHGLEGAQGVQWQPAAVYPHLGHGASPYLGVPIFTPDPGGLPMPFLDAGVLQECVGSMPFEHSPM